MTMVPTRQKTNMSSVSWWLPITTAKRVTGRSGLFVLVLVGVGALLWGTECRILRNLRSTTTAKTFTSDLSPPTTVQYAQTLVHPAMIGTSPTATKVLVVSDNLERATVISREVLKWSTVQEVVGLISHKKQKTTTVTVDIDDSFVDFHHVSYQDEVSREASFLKWLQHYFLVDTSQGLCHKWDRNGALLRKARFDLIYVDLAVVPLLLTQSWIRYLACSTKPYGALGMYVGEAPIAGSVVTKPNHLTAYHAALSRIEEFSRYFRFTRVYDKLLPVGGTARFEAFVVGLVPNPDNILGDTDPSDDIEETSVTQLPKVEHSSHELEEQIVPEVLRIVAGINDFEGNSARINLVRSCLDCPIVMRFFLTISCRS
jgi:hypothetical protein